MSAPGVTAIAAMPFREIDTNGEYIEPIEQWNIAEYSAFGGNLPILFSDDGMERYETPHYIVKPDLTGPPIIRVQVCRVSETLAGHRQQRPTWRESPH